MPLEGFAIFDFNHEQVTRSVFRAGEGPGVIVMHVLPGLSGLS